MSKSEDINTLFRRFGGDANSYQEIVAGELADVAEQKWPILGQVRLQAPLLLPLARPSHHHCHRDRHRARLLWCRRQRQPNCQPCSLRMRTFLRRLQTSAV